MKPAPFAYAKARSLEDAVRLLGEHATDARLLAGGQSLIATLNMRLSQPSLLIDINGIRRPRRHRAERRRCRDRRAGPPRRRRERSDVIARHAPLIARAMPHIGHPAIRNRGTHRRLHRLCRSGGRIAGLPARARRRSRDRRARAAQRTRQGATISSRACSRPRSAPDEMLTAIRAARRRRRHALRLRRIGAPARRLRASSGWPPPRAPMATG